MNTIINLVVGNCEGGLAELLRAEERALKRIGFEVQTLEFRMPNQMAQAVSDAMHNLGYDSSPYDKNFVVNPPSMTKTLREIAYSVNLPKLTLNTVVIAHDAQAAGFIPLLSGQVRSVIWRHHLGANPLGIRAHQFWTVLRPLLEEHADLVITHGEIYNPAWMDRVLRFDPGIDQGSPKNLRDNKSANFFDTSRLSAICECSTPDYDLLTKPEKQQTVSISRWAPLKAPICVFQTVSRAMEIDHDFEHVMIGPVPLDPAAKEIFATISSLHRKLPACSRKRFHLVTMKESGTSDADSFLRLTLKNSDVFLALSLQEGFGLSVTEALNHGVAVVGRDVGGIARQVSKTGGGLLGAETHEFVDLLLGLLSDPEARSDKQRAGLEGVERYYCARASARRLVDGLNRFGCL